MPAEQTNRLYAELWISFVALIRSYVAAHDLARPTGSHAKVEERDSSYLILRGEHRALTLEFDIATGEGRWTIYEGDLAWKRVLERGEFKMDENSQVSFSDRLGKLELETATESFTARFFDEE